jgi:hypothetical protein
LFPQKNIFIFVFQIIYHLVQYFYISDGTSFLNANSTFQSYFRNFGFAWIQPRLRLGQKTHTRTKGCTFWPWYTNNYVLRKFFHCGKPKQNLFLLFEGANTFRITKNRNYKYFLFAAVTKQVFISNLFHSIDLFVCTNFLCSFCPSMFGCCALFM